MPQDGPRGNEPAGGEELLALEHKRILINQADKMFVLLTRLVFPAIVAAFAAILIFIFEGGNLEQLNESLKYPIKSARSFVELLIVLGISMLLAWIPVIQATSTISEPSISRDLNILVHGYLRTARWMMFIVAFSAMVAIAIFGLRMVEILPLTGILALVAVLVILMIMLGTFIVAMGYAAWIALRKYKCRFFAKVILLGYGISSIFVIGTSILYIFSDTDLILFIISMVAVSLFSFVAMMVPMSIAIYQYIKKGWKNIKCCKKASKRRAETNQEDPEQITG